MFVGLTFPPGEFVFDDDALITCCELGVMVSCLVDLGVLPLLLLPLVVESIVCLLLLLILSLLVKVVSMRILGRGGVPPFIPACNDNWVGVVILLLLFSFDSEPSVSTSSIVPPPLLLPLLPVKLLRDIRLRMLINFFDIIVFFILLLFDDDNGVLLVLLGVAPLKSGDEDDFFISFVGCGGGVSG